MRGIFLTSFLAVVFLKNLISPFVGEASYAERDGQITYSGESMKNSNKIPSFYDRLEINDIPRRLELTADQQKYLAEIIISLNNVITQSSSLEAEEKKILGVGNFFWPKNPSAPTQLIRYYKAQNFRMPGIALTLKRINRDSAWNMVALTIYPRNFPYGSYIISLPDTIIQDYQITKIVNEVRVDEQINNPTVYYFRHKTKKGISIKIESLQNGLHEVDELPKNFYAIEFNKE